MSKHKHRWFHPQATLACKCGADGQACEGCTKIMDLADMMTDAEGNYLCPSCWESCIEENRRRKP